jgi:hypothetical protein
MAVILLDDAWLTCRNVRSWHEAEVLAQGGYDCFAHVSGPVADVPNTSAHDP